jgi:hypothetical protein
VHDAVRAKLLTPRKPALRRHVVGYLWQRRKNARPATGGAPQPVSLAGRLPFAALPRASPATRFSSSARERPVRFRDSVAVGHAILIIAYQLLRDGTGYHDLGPRYLDERDRRAVKRRLVHHLEDLGYTVSLSPAA